MNHIPESPLGTLFGTLALAMPTTKDGLFHTSSPSGRNEHSSCIARTTPYVRVQPPPAARRQHCTQVARRIQIKARACLDVVSAALLHCFQLDAINASNPKRLFFSPHVEVTSYELDLRFTCRMRPLSRARPLRLQHMA